MVKKIKLILVFIIGLLFGLIIHGLVEIITIWVLLNWLKDLFYQVSWATWCWVHIISMIVLEILGLLFALWFYIKYETEK